MFVYRALAYNVLAVASINEKVGDWSAYIGAVAGYNHDAEHEEVARTGNKLPKNLAALIFPYEAGKFRWRE